MAIFFGPGIRVAMIQVRSVDTVFPGAVVQWYSGTVVQLLKTFLFQASCGRMGREKIEDLVCAPHLSYTQQVGQCPTRTP